MKKIVFITSGQPSLNPRLVKEADLLSDKGFEVTVIYQYWNEWGTKVDLELFKTKKWKKIRVGGNPNYERLTYFISRILHRIGTLGISIFGIRNIFAELAVKRNALGLMMKAKSIKADLYIAHNLSALPAVVLASRKYNAKSGFDAEDFHRQEQTDDVGNLNYRLAKFIEDKYLKQIDYITAASPLIAKAYQKVYPFLKPVTINNVFPLSLIQLTQSGLQIKSLKLFWFSQTIGKGRGIEDVIQALSMINKPSISLTLLGHIDEIYKKELTLLANKHFLVNQLIFVNPINSDDIFKYASSFDIGLSLEINTPFNRDICLTNKLFTYLISGLTIVASETAAQKEFISQNSGVGFSYPIGDINALAEIIHSLDQNRSLLLKTKQNSVNLAKDRFNWDQESIYFLETINRVLTD